MILGKRDRRRVGDWYPITRTALFLCDVLCVITLPFYPVQGYYFQCGMVQEREKRFAPNSNPSLQFRTLCCIEMHPQVVNCHGRGREFESRRPRNFETNHFAKRLPPASKVAT